MNRGEVGKPESQYQIMILPEPITLDPRSCTLVEKIAEVPAQPGVYVLYPAAGAPHLSWSANLARRLKRILVSSPDDRAGSIRRGLHGVECWPTTSRLEASLVMYDLARKFFSQDYLKRLRLRIPFFVGLTADAFPRLQIVNRVSRSRALFGPFASRDAAERYAEAVSGLFQIRRCSERLAPHPAHPGCIYGEMNQCLRPCQEAVTSEGYAGEVQRVADFLASNGRAALTRLVMERDRASASLDFETAAQLHKRSEKVAEASSVRDAVIADVMEFNGVALTRGANAYEFRLWPMFHGYWQRALLLNFSDLEFQSKSLDGEIRERLALHLAEPEATGDRAEQLAIFARWYYSSWRDGEWFGFRTLADLNYRKIVREISKARQT